MPMTRKTITLPDAMDRWIKTQIAQGRYGNDSEYVRDLIRRDQDTQDRLAALQEAIRAGRESGAGKSTVDALISEAQAELDAGL